ncbi:dephospho-CoA kinase [Roseivirga thermotolerans]|uniref:Dephospho-CoA kinase n=1 Tax=Roseivirga thermotolerans TaxID=1758176 RepID=A0ABQ3HZR4_9BACT|nr:dephospho-CoA kinase [Roseivirga thermotolerans]GHE50420.1 dephospho-CoA kinase [Roseivirga thermotolerans]
MNKPRLIGITGGIGSGKSTVTKMFQLLGVPVYYADDRGKQLMIESDTLRQGIAEAFGAESYLPNGELNRSYLASRVFSNPQELAILNSLVHPAVAQDFDQWAAGYQSVPYVLKEAALLFETESYKQLDQTICVMAPRAVRLERVLLRDEQRNRQQVEDIMERQVGDAQRKKLADYLIDNSGNALVIPQVLQIHKSLLGL